MLYRRIRASTMQSACVGAWAQEKNGNWSWRLTHDAKAPTGSVFISGAYFSNLFSPISCREVKCMAHLLASTPVIKRLWTGIIGYNCRSNWKTILAPIHKRLHCTCPKSKLKQAPTPGPTKLRYHPWHPSQMTCCHSPWRQGLSPQLVAASSVWRLPDLPWR
jgi:hypothetical protein